MQKNINKATLVVLKNGTNALIIHIFLLSIFVAIQFFVAFFLITIRFVVKNWNISLIPIVILCLILTWLNPQQQLYELKILVIITLYLTLVAISIYRNFNMLRLNNKAF